MYYFMLDSHVEEHKNEEAECKCFNRLLDAKHEKVDPRQITHHATTITSDEATT